MKEITKKVNIFHNKFVNASYIDIYSSLLYIYLTAYNYLTIALLAYFALRWVFEPICICHVFIMEIHLLNNWFSNYLCHQPHIAHYTLKSY